MRALFLPSLPDEYAGIRGILKRLGWSMTDDMQTSFDFAVSWVNYKNTWQEADYRAHEVLQQVMRSGRFVINGEVRTAHKTFVEECHRAIFGYGMAVDPTAYHGEMIEKSVHNATHDGLMIQGPIRAEEVKPEKVYQKNIIARSPDGNYVDIRVSVFDRIPTWAVEHWKTPEHRFNGGSRAYNLVSMRPEEMFSIQEVDLIGRFCALYRLDYGELDLLRDSDDGRLYILDVNPTPGTNRFYFNRYWRTHKNARLRYYWNFRKAKKDVTPCYVEPFRLLVEKHAGALERREHSL
jgi:hypothetical protein